MNQIRNIAASTRCTVNQRRRGLRKDGDSIFRFLASSGSLYQYHYHDKKNKPPKSTVCFSSSSTITGIDKGTKSWERSAQLVKNTDVNNKYLDVIRADHDPTLQVKTMEDELRGTMGKALGKQGEKICNALRVLHEERIKYYRFILDIGQNVEVEQVAQNNNTTTAAIENTDESPTDSNMEQKIHQISFQKLSPTQQQQMVSILETYNQYLKKAKQARWELTVHRQAVGFIVNNNKFVQMKFPLPLPLPYPHDLDYDDLSIGIGNDPTKRTCCTSSGNEKKYVGNEAVERNFGDQLSWWEQIGRWR
jgi:hypothetical protein